MNKTYYDIGSFAEVLPTGERCRLAIAYDEQGNRFEIHLGTEGRMAVFDDQDKFLGEYVGMLEHPRPRCMNCD